MFENTVYLYDTAINDTAKNMCDKFKIVNR